MTPMRRYRFPSVDILLVALAVIVGIIAATGVVLAILAYGKINPTIQAIQAERARNVRANCLDTNDRHDRTIATLDRRLQVAVRRAPPAQARQIRASREFSVALINALAPRRDCERLVKRQVRTAR
jgi:cell division protein FtsN